MSIFLANFLQNIDPLSQASLHVDSILAAVVENVNTVAEMDRSSSTRVHKVTQNICKLKEYLTAIEKLELSSAEFGLLKIIAMFNADPASVNSDYYESLSDKAGGNVFHWNGIKLLFRSGMYEQKNSDLVFLIANFT